jgi:UDP-glucose 4-epimerase
MITGAAGFIGSHLADRLAAGSELILLDDFSIGARENLAALEGRPNVRIVEADVTNREAVQDLMSGVDVVIHMAISCLRTSLGEPLLSHDINAGGTLNVCMGAQRHGVSRLVYVSSSEIYGTAETVPMSEEHPCRPTTVYGASKLAGELYALAYWRTAELPVSVVRPFNTYGPREPWAGKRAEVIPRFLIQLLTDQPVVVYGDGTQTRDFTYVDDTVTGLVAAAECDALVGGIVNVARGHEVSIGEIAERLARLVGREASSVCYAAPRPGDVHRHLGAIDKARALFGFTPRVDIDTGLARTAEWFRTERIAERSAAGAAGTPNW